MHPQQQLPYVLTGSLWGFPRHHLTPTLSTGVAGTGTPNGHEHYYCSEYGINYSHYGGTGKNNVRIGTEMSQECGCGHPGTAEGIGLWDNAHNDRMVH